MVNNSGLVDCAVCGLALGSGISGGKKYCQRCGSYVTTEVRAGSGNFVGGLVILGVGLLVGLAAVSVLRMVFGGDS